MFRNSVVYVSHHSHQNHEDLSRLFICFDLNLLSLLMKNGYMLTIVDHETRNNIHFHSYAIQRKIALHELLLTF